MDQAPPTNFEDYAARFPEPVAQRLRELRELVLRCAPDAVESISYGMPAYKTYGKPLVYFGGYEKHIGWYATPSGHAQFKEALKAFKQGKGSVQFPHNQPLPWETLEALLVFRVEENKPSKS